MWPLIAAASAVGSLFVLPTPRPLLALGATALVAFLFLSPPRPPAAAVPRCAAKGLGPLSAGYPEVCRIVASLRFARAYTDVDGSVAQGIERFLAVFVKRPPTQARLQALEMAREALVRDVLSITYCVPPSCRDHTILAAARAVHRFTSACIEQVRAGLGMAPDTAPEPVAFDAGAPVA